jgi:hypothetical protein
VRCRLIYLTVAAALCAVAFSFFRLPLVRAAESGYVSDTITDSRLSWPTNHEIVFEVPNGVPASGKIVVAFENASFSIDPSFSYTDVDLAVSPDSPMSDFVERSLAAVPDATDDGVAVTPITGPVTITLSSGAGIPAGSYVRILLGTNAPAGAYQITNPSSTASYRILLNTYDSLGGALDYGTAMVAILPGVGVDVNQSRVNPAVLSNGLPSGTIPSNVAGVLVSFNTDVYATCRYATSSGIAYDDMTNSATGDFVGTFHTFTIMGIVQGDTYTFYVRCEDFTGNKNPNDYVITFTAGNPTGTGLGGGVGGVGVSPGTGGSGGGGGGGAPYPAALAPPALVITGVTMPNVSIAVLEDGSKIPVATIADGSGNFSVNVTSLSQGTYSFTIQAVGNSGVPISAYTATVTLISGTTNSITGIVLPPSIGFSTSTVALGKTISLTGLSVPSSTVDLVVTSQANVRKQFEATTTANQNGTWSYKLSTASFPMDTYQLKVRALVTGFAASNFSSISFLGVGEAANPKLKTGDLNGDGKVNLVDFSILLAHWGANWPPGDLNGNGKVDLPDLSIMLFNWTG